MGLALHWKAMDGDPSWTIITLLAVAIGLVTLGFLGSLALRHRGRRDYKTNVVPMVKQNCERAERCQQMADRVAALEEQQAVEVRYRKLLMATWEQAFRAVGEEPPAEIVTATSERPKLRLIKSEGA